VTVVGVGTAGLLAAGLIWSPALLVLAAGAILPWLAAILVADTSRYLDPMLPLMLFGVVVVAFEASGAIRRAHRKAPVSVQRDPGVGSAPREGVTWRKKDVNPS
jgi:hypothetical protein